MPRFLLFALLGFAFLPPQTDLKEGDKAPFFITRSVHGDSVNLEQFRGSPVFIHFWASWDPVSRKNNPDIARLFDKYHTRRGRKKSKLQVISVSLDERYDQWLAAVKQDNMAWTATNACDFKGWSSSLFTLYTVRSIPASYLVNAEGTIVAKNLFGVQLEKSIDSLLLVSN